jgi:glycosyltransferase involved in cell wall biosynthesis
MKTFRILRGKGFVRTLIIVGDPWESFLHGYIIRIFLGESTLIQTNIHADIFDDSWVKQKFIHRLRSKFSWFSIKRSNSIRVVSSQVARRISQKFPNKLITNAPIATNFNLVHRSLDRKNIKKPVVLGWVGRFEEDRGVRDFVEFVIGLNMINTTFEIEMAGKGKLLEQTKRALNNELGLKRITYLGYLQGADLNKVYEDIDILLTFAKSESYGLAIREALRFGKPVWGVESLGLKRLQDLVGEKFVRVLDTTAELKTLESTMEDLASCLVPASVAAKISKIDAENISLLIKSWAELLFTNIPKVK